MSVKRLRWYFICSGVMLTVFSMTILIMPLSNMLDGRKQKIVLLAVGSLFWFSFFFGYLFLFLAKGMNRKLTKSQKKDEKENRLKKVSFYSFDMPTAIADTCFLTGWLVLFLLKLANQTTGYVIYIDLFIIVLSFHAHLLLSGSLYKKVIGDWKCEKEGEKKI